MGLGPPNVMKTASVQQRLFPEAPPFPLSSRPEQSAVERSAVSAALSLFSLKHWRRMFKQRRNSGWRNCGAAFFEAKILYPSVAQQEPGNIPLLIACETDVP
jgi:hypothetical protein